MGKVAAPDELWNEAEAAVYLGMTSRQLADRRRAGKIGCLKDGHFIAYTPEHIRTYLTAICHYAAFDAENADRLLAMLSKNLRNSKGKR
jgi:hypothetical protein